MLHGVNRWSIEFYEELAPELTPFYRLVPAVKFSLVARTDLILKQAAVELLHTQGVRAPVRITPPSGLLGLVQPA